MEKRKVGTTFAGVLAFISIAGFLEIISKGLFNYSFIEYSSSLWLFIMGVGFLISSRPKNLYETTKRQITETAFARLTTLVVGLLAIVSAILTLPQINITHPALGTTSAIISIIAILFIIAQTWILDH